MSATNGQFGDQNSSLPKMILSTMIPENLTYPPVSIAVFIECPTFNNQRRIKYYEGQESVLGFVQNI